jgi:hypothetical protein
VCSRQWTVPARIGSLALPPPRLRFQHTSPHTAAPETPSRSTAATTHPPQNKLIKPLQEVFKAAVPPAQQGAVLAELLGGDHTRVRVDALSPPPPALGPASPPPRGRGRGKLHLQYLSCTRSQRATWLHIVKSAAECIN